MRRPWLLVILGFFKFFGLEVEDTFCLVYLSSLYFCVALLDPLLYLLAFVLGLEPLDPPRPPLPALTSCPI